MKRIIEGRLYNTETAVCIGNNDNGYLPSDFNYYKESLYQKKNKEFFLVRDGGAMSCCGRFVGGSYCGGTDIIPYSVEEAKEWCAQYIDVDEYFEIFGAVEE